MKALPRFSSPVLALAAVLIGILALIGWLRFKPAQDQRPQTASADTKLPEATRVDPVAPSEAPLTPVQPQPSANGSNSIQESNDPLSATSLIVRVVDANNQPVPDAKVRARISQREPAQPRSTSRSVVTDTTGTAQVALPPAQDLASLDLNVSHDNYGGRKVSWSTGRGDVIPSSYTFKLGEGLSLGGTILDETGAPISDAKLNFGRFWTGSDQMYAKSEEADFSSRSTLTDSAGKWHVNGAPPELLDRIRFTVSHPDFVETNMTVGGSPDREAKIRAGTHILVLYRGLPVFGRVIDQSGQPIENAQVWAGKMNYSGTQKTNTDPQGTFRFGNLRRGNLQFSVLAKGFRPELRDVEVLPEMQELVFQLGAGAVIRGIVQDEVNQPVEGVRISLEDKSGGVSQEFQFDMTSGPDGRFEWAGAPNEPRNFAILKAGYMAKRGQTLQPNLENVITLSKSAKVLGLVLDAKTSKPISKFRVGVGRDVGGFYADYPGMGDYSSADGAFQFQIHEEQSRWIKVEADDYSDKVEQLPPPENGIVQVVFRLAPSAALRALLVDSRGQPVAGGTVALAMNDQPGRLGFANGRLTAMSSSTKLTTSDANGLFTLSSPPETGGLVIASAQSGFASATVEQVRSAGYLTLQDFGSIEGTIRIAGAPAQGQEFTYNIQNQIVMPDWSASKVTSDENGRFRFDKVPAGEISVVRLIRSGENSWSHSHRTDVTIQPGQTANVRFGEDGAVIQGQFTLDYQPAEGEKLVFSGRLNSKRPDTAQSFSTAAEAQALMRKLKSYAVTVSPEGGFYVDSVSSGDYTLTIDARKVSARPWEGLPVATATVAVTIPEGVTPNTPITLGDLVLRPSK